MTRQRFTAVDYIMLAVIFGILVAWVSFLGWGAYKLMQWAG